MAKRESEDTRVATTEAPGQLARPNWIKKGDVRGTESITRADLTIPRIGLAQQMSPELVAGDLKEIPGLKVGDMFNTLTREIYGRGPLEVVIVRRDPPRWVEFYPRDAGGGIKDLNVPAGDPRTLFGSGPDGKPAATQFYDFLVMFYPPQREPQITDVISASFKSSGLKMARDWNGYIKQRNAPLFAGRYALESIMTKNRLGTFAIIKVRNAGWIADEYVPAFEALFTSLADRKVEIHTEGEADPDAPGAESEM